VKSVNILHVSGATLSGFVMIVGKQHVQVAWCHVGPAIKTYACLVEEIICVWVSKGDEQMG
jgi:hypothetical protein